MCYILTSSPDAVEVEHVAEVPEPHHVAGVGRPAHRHAVVVARLGHAAPLATHLK